MDYTDAGLWLHGVSAAAAASIKEAAFGFRSSHGLDDAAWHVRAYGVSGGYIDIWIGAHRRRLIGSRTRYSTAQRQGRSFLRSSNTSTRNRPRHLAPEATMNRLASLALTLLTTLGLARAQQISSLQQCPDPPTSY